MNITFTPNGWADYQHWQQTDKKIIKRINTLLKEITRTPFQGQGNPEALKHQLAGYWSRRITQEHRLVYQVKDETIIVVQCRYHY